jgi:hypothetical protein
MAFPTSGHDSSVAELSGCSGVPFKQPAAFDNTASDAGADKQGHHISRTSTCTVTEFAPGGGLDVVDHDCRQTQRFVQFRAEGYVVPFEIGRKAHNAVRGVDLAGDAYADASNRVSIDETADAFDDSIYNCFVPAIGIGWMAPGSDDPAAVVNNSSLDFSSTKVDPYSDPGLMRHQELLVNLSSGARPK